MTCPTCGMDEVNHGVCAYCGRSVSPRPAAPKPVFSKPAAPVVRTAPPPAVLPAPHTVATVQMPAAPGTVRPVKKGKGGQWVLRFLFLCAAVAWIVLLSFLIESFSNGSGRMPETGHEGGMALAVVVFLMAIFARGGVIRRLLALGGLGITSVMLIVKPFVAPAKYWDYTNNIYTNFSYKSETNMNYWVPGVFLAVFTAIFVLNMFIRVIAWFVRGRSHA